MPAYDQWLGEAARHVRTPIPDFGVPTPEQMAQTLDIIDVAIGSGHAVYVHCLGGLGRTGTVVGCYLVRHGLQGAEALNTIQLLRRGTPGAGSDSPETGLQQWMVLTWRNGQ
jgi:protein-tyrosine phosphatase